MTHNAVNELSEGEWMLREFLEGVVSLSGNDTIIFLGADHGNRNKDLRDSFIGRIEVSMPLFSVILPPKLRREKPELLLNLKRNKKMMTTHFDIYETLKLAFLIACHTIVHRLRDCRDIASQFKKPREKISIPQKMSKQRAYSLFQPVPRDRNCFRSAIPLGYCICRPEGPLDLASSCYFQISF